MIRRREKQEEDGRAANLFPGMKRREEGTLGKGRRVAPRRAAILWLAGLMLFSGLAGAAAEGQGKHEHNWSRWKLKQEPTCSKNGKRQRECSICGATEDLVIEKLGHEAEEWTYTKEPTCQKDGERIGECLRCGKKMKERVPHLEHEFGEWETEKAAGDFSAGKRAKTCRLCGRRKTESFDPEGTLARKKENDPEAVRVLQAALKTLGFYRKDPTGTFDKNTETAVKQAQRAWGLTKDGIAWPGVLRLLGLQTPGADGAKGITQDPAGFHLRLTVQQVSAGKESYRAGDEITYEWILANGTEGKVYRDVTACHFRGRKSVPKTDETMEKSGVLKAGETMTGTYTYTVTEEDAAEGTFFQGFTVRGKMASGAAETSNAVIFVNNCGSDT